METPENKIAADLEELLTKAAAESKAAELVAKPAIVPADLFEPDVATEPDVAAIPAPAPSESPAAPAPSESPKAKRIRPSRSKAAMAARASAATGVRMKVAPTAVKLKAKPAPKAKAKSKPVRKHFSRKSAPKRKPARQFSRKVTRRMASTVRPGQLRRGRKPSTKLGMVRAAAKAHGGKGLKIEETKAIPRFTVLTKGLVKAAAGYVRPTAQGRALLG